MPGAHKVVCAAAGSAGQPEEGLTQGVWTCVGLACGAAQAPGLGLRGIPVLEGGHLSVPPAEQQCCCHTSVATGTALRSLHCMSVLYPLHGIAGMSCQE
jgi:hypothetical protein